jgi:hypothetical protein
MTYMNSTTDAMSSFSSGASITIFSIILMVILGIILIYFLLYLKEFVLGVSVVFVLSILGWLSEKSVNMAIVERDFSYLTSLLCVVVGITMSILFGHYIKKYEFFKIVKRRFRE